MKYLSKAGSLLAETTVQHLTTIPSSSCIDMVGKLVIQDCNRRKRRLLESYSCNNNASLFNLKNVVLLVLVYMMTSSFRDVRAAPNDIVKRYNCGGGKAYVDDQGNRWYQHPNEIGRAHV